MFTVLSNEELSDLLGRMHKEIDRLYWADWHRIDKIKAKALISDLHLIVTELAGVRAGRSWMRSS